MLNATPDLAGFLPKVDPGERMSRCQSCRRWSGASDMVSIGPSPSHCWPCWIQHVASVPRLDLASWSAQMPAGWYQRCERCDVRTWVTQDRPLCPQCRRVPTKWRSTLTICPNCGTLHRRKGRSRSCCSATDVRGRRMVAARVLSTHTAAEWQAKLNEFAHRCAYCGAADQGLTKDHVVPISRGGSDGIANLVPACQPCNSGKRDRLLGKEWLPVRFREGKFPLEN